MVDECDKVLDGGHEMEELMKIWGQHHDNSGCGQQLIMSCSRVTEQLRKFVMDYMKGSVKLIACAIESVIWREVPMVGVSLSSCDLQVMSSATGCTVLP